MPQPFGNFGIWTEGNTTKAKRFVVWVDPHNETETIVIHCQTPNEAERYCAYLNAVIQGQIKIPRSQKNWKL